jgi:hypothetical protein
MIDWIINYKNHESGVLQSCTYLHERREGA